VHGGSDQHGRLGHGQFALRLFRSDLIAERVDLGDYIALENLGVVVRQDAA
jgi:hypothetical protein